MRHINKISSFFISTLMLLSIGCVNPKNNKSMEQPILNATSTEIKTSDAPLASAKVVSTNSTSDSFSHFSMTNEINRITHGDFTSPSTLLLIIENSSALNIGYGLCMAAGRAFTECNDALGASNIGFGICMAGGRNFTECNEALGAENTGYGLCMAAGRSISDCNDALGASNIGFGLCMAGGRNFTDCNDAIGLNNIGFGICMAGNQNFKDCNDALGGDNTGYGFCMAAGRNFKDCNDALGSNNTGFGICMAAGHPFKSCNDALKANNTGFGLCMAGNRDPKNCNDALGADNTGFGFCMAGGRSFSDCNDALNKPSTGFGLCMLGGRNNSDCNDSLGSLNTGYGLCMAAGRSEGNCDNLLGNNNIGYGACLAGGRDKTDCNDASDALFNLGPSDFILSNDVSTHSINGQVVSSTDPIKVYLTLNPDSSQINQIADIYIVASVTRPDGSVSFYQKNGSSFIDWDKNFNTLIPDSRDVKLFQTQAFKIFDGRLEGIQGKINLYYGYLLKGSPIDQIIYNRDREISFIVK